MKKMMKIVGVLLLAISPVLVFSQGEIHGKVFDEETKEPIPYANVSVKIGNTLVGATTDFDGRFKVKPLDAGVYKVSITYVGKVPTKISEVTVLKDNITYVDDVYMGSSIDMEEFEVVEIRYKGAEILIDKDNPTVMHLLPAQIKQSPQTKNINAMLATSSSEIFQADETQPLYVRGARNDAVQYMVNGIKTRNATGGVPSSAVGSIQVYTGGVPAKYGDVTSGVIVVETKSYFDLYNAEKDE